MASREIVEYIKQEMRAGHAPALIEQALLDVGWSASDVAEAVQEVGIPEEINAVDAQSVGGLTLEGNGILDGAVNTVATGSGFQFPQPTGPSALDRNLASREGISAGASIVTPSVGLAIEHADADSLPLSSRIKPQIVTMPANTSVGSPRIGLDASVPVSRLGAQSTGGSLVDFTGGGSVLTPTASSSLANTTVGVPVGIAGPTGMLVTPTMTTASFGNTENPVSQLLNEEKKKSTANSWWYALVGFLLGVLITLFILGGYIYFSV